MSIKNVFEEVLRLSVPHNYVKAVGYTENTIIIYTTSKVTLLSEYQGYKLETRLVSEHHDFVYAPDYITYK